MTTILLLSCVLWVKGEYTNVVDVPLDEYETAQVKKEIRGFLFEADVFEGKMNSMKITKMDKDTSTMVFTYDRNQNSLVAKLNIGSDESSLSCEIQRRLKP